jgi:hypothetical protein
VPILVDLLCEPINVLIRLGPQRRSDHPPRTRPCELVERVQHLLVAPSAWKRDNIRHRRAFLAGYQPASVFTQPGRYAAFFLKAVVHNIRL